MISAAGPRTERETARLLVLHWKEAIYKDAVITDLPELLQPGDVLIVNDAATLPASLFAKSPSGSPIEIRLLQYLGDSDWKAVLLGSGDWRTPTELRDAPERLAPGSVLRIHNDFTAEVANFGNGSGRLVTLRFSRHGVDMWAGIYAYGHPIQYAHLNSDLALWSVQTAYASRPWAMEMPSAGQPLTWRILLELKRRGIGLACLTHAAGVSSIGDESLDAHLPFTERFEIPQSAIDAIQKARLTGGRVIAVGTTVVRALEGCSVQNDGHLTAGAGETDLIIGPSFRRSVVDGILTGLHGPEQSHFQLLRAFADDGILRRSWQYATENNYVSHEFGDLCLIIE